jgi:hypothetical protein
MIKVAVLFPDNINDVDFREVHRAVSQGIVVVLVELFIVPTHPLLFRTNQTGKVSVMTTLVASPQSFFITTLKVNHVEDI